MMRRLALLLLLALPASAQTIAGETAELQLTNESTRANANWYSGGSQMAYADGNLFVAWNNCVQSDGCDMPISEWTDPCSENESTSTDVLDGVRLRVYSLDSVSASSSVELFPEASYISSDITHENPTLVAQSGTIHAFNGAARAARCDCTDAANEGPLEYRTVTASTWSNTATWSSVGCAPGGSVNLSTGTSRNDDPYCIDAQAVVSGDGTLVLNCKGSLWTDTANAGIGRIVWRRTLAGTWVGPYQLIRSPAQAPDSTDGSCVPSGNNNYFAQGTMSVDQSGVVYFLWTNRHTFGTTTPGGNVTHSYDLFAIKSTDGGATWTAIDGTASFTPGDTASSGVTFKTAAYRIWTGDLEELTTNHFDFDSAGRMYVGLLKYRTGGTTLCGHVNAAGSGDEYSLVMLRQTVAGGSFSEVPIDTTRNFKTENAIPAVDAQDRIWLVTSADRYPSAAGTEGMGYRVSTDAGATWSARQDLSQDVHTGANVDLPDRLVPLMLPGRQRLALAYHGGPTTELWVKVVDFSRLTYLRGAGLRGASSQ